MLNVPSTVVSEHIVQLEAWLGRALADRDSALAYGRVGALKLQEAQILVDLLKTQLDLRRRQRMP